MEVIVARYIRNRELTQKNTIYAARLRSRTKKVRRFFDLQERLPLQMDQAITELPIGVNLSSLNELFLKEVEVLIDANLDNPDLNVEELARKLYMDRSTLYRKLVAIIGESPLQFIKSRRLERAAVLLKNKSNSVLGVSLDVGFSYHSYFSRCFKKKFLKKPSGFFSL
jgi:AraC-like DNA-binding protein